MEFLKGWMIAIMSVTILSTLVELIMPEAEMRKYAKLVVGIILMIILIRPIAQIKELDILTKEYQLTEQMAVTEQAKNLEEVQWDQIEQEFSIRLQDIIIKKLGSTYSHIQLEACLSQDGIDELLIKNAKETEKDALKKLIHKEFEISPDKITFIGG